jgi:hypothetical protein
MLAAVLSIATDTFFWQSHRVLEAFLAQRPQNRAPHAGHETLAQEEEMLAPIATAMKQFGHALVTSQRFLFTEDCTWSSSSNDVPVRSTSE